MAKAKTTEEKVAEEFTAEPVDTRTKKQKAVDEHKAKAEYRAGALKALNAAYLTAMKSPALPNLIKTITEFVDYHKRVAQDGVAYEQKTTSDDKGKPHTVQNVIKLIAEERVAHLDKAAAQQEILDYIDRRVGQVV